MEENLAVGQILRMLREDRGWTLRYAAKKLGVSFANLAAKERGRVGTKPPERRDMAKAYGLTPEEFDSRWRALMAQQQPCDLGLSRGVAPIIERLALATERLALALEQQGRS